MAPSTPDPSSTSLPSLPGPGSTSSKRWTSEARTSSRAFGPSERGYTMVELMMAMALFAIGVSGIMAMEKVTIEAGRHAKNMAMATNIAEAWGEALVTDSVQWNHPAYNGDATADDLTSTIWLQQVAGQNNLWIRPVYSATLDLGPSFDAQGVRINPGVSPQPPTQFCTDLRLTWVRQGTTPTPGSGVIRAEVRVFWPRDARASTGTLAADNFCPATTALSTAAEPDYHFVYFSTAVTQHPASP